MKKMFAAFALATIMSVSAVQAKNLRLSNMAASTGTESRLVEEVFIPFIEKNSNGKYKIDYYPNSSLGNAETVVQGLVMGTIDLAMDTASNLDQFCPSLGLLDLPFIFKREDMGKLNDSEIGQKFRDTGKKTGLYIIDLNGWFPRNLISRKPLHTVDEIKNAKDRTTGSKWQMIGVEAMGMKPVPTPAAEMLTAIQQGMVDSMDINLPAMLSFRVVDVAKNATLTEHAQMMGAVLTSSEFWDDLPEEDKKLFKDAATAYREALDKAVANETPKLVQKIKDAGVEVVKLDQEEREKLRTLTEQNLDKLLSPEDKALVDEIRNAVK